MNKTYHVPSFVSAHEVVNSNHVGIPQTQVCMKEERGVRWGWKKGGWEKEGRGKGGGKRRCTRDHYAWSYRWNTHTRTQILIIPFILPASSYCAWGCGDLADRAENRPPFPHLPESSEEQTKPRELNISSPKLATFLSTLILMVWLAAKVMRFRG